MAVRVLACVFGYLPLPSSDLPLRACAVRVLTTTQEGGGRNMLISYLTSLSLNFTLMAQIVYFNMGAKKIKKSE
jgi:hypothetical protein